jgi:hypothetical protein
MSWQGFRWEHDVWWWERVRLDELGLPEKWNFVLPDKLMHFLAVFGLTWLLSRWLGRHWAMATALFIMLVPWEIVWDGCFRYGASWRDIVADVLGGVICWWWLASKVVGQSQL